MLLGISVPDNVLTYRLIYISSIPEMMLAYLLFSNVVDRILVNVFGILVSTYALYVEEMKEKNPNYRALCDFNESMSCSRVLTSK